MTTPFKREDLFPADLPPLHRILSPEEFQQAQTLSPEALRTPGLFPLLPPVPKAQPKPVPTPEETTQGIVDQMTPMARDLARYGILKAHSVAHALSYPFHHPLDFALGVVRAPFDSFGTLISPDSAGAAEMNNPDSQYQRSMLARFGEEIPVTPVTGRERVQAGIQTAANMLAPSFGPMLGGAAAGAAYSPDDPVSGAIAGAIFGKTVDTGVKIAGKALGGSTAATVEPSEPAAPGMERTADEASLAQQAQADRNASRAAVQNDREASRNAVRRDLEASRQAVRSHAQQLRASWQQMFQHAPEGQEARQIIRSTTGAMAAQYEQSAFKLDEFRRLVDPLSDQQKLDLIDAIETGAYRSGLGPVAEGQPGALYEASRQADQYYGNDTELRSSFLDGFHKGDTRGSLVDPGTAKANPYREGTPHWTAWEQGFTQAYDPTQAGSGLPEGVKLTPQGGFQFPLDPEFHPFIDAVRSTLDNARNAIQSLGTGKLDHWIEDYFPHIWSDPDNAAIVMRSIGNKAPFEGPASFLKERTIPTTKEGIAQGLQPVTTNPIDLTLLKLREMNRYLMAHQSLTELKDAGLVKFVRSGDMIPDGYTPINDKIGTVFGPRRGAVKLPEGAMTPEIAADRIQTAKSVPSAAPSDEAEAARMDEQFGEPTTPDLPRPRTASGSLKNLTKATPEEIGNEYKLLVDANAEEGVGQRTPETDYGDRLVVGTQGSMRAAGRKAARAKTIAKLETEMERRGIDPTHAYMDAHERATNADPTGFDFSGEAPLPTPSGGDEPPAPDGTPLGGAGMRPLRPEDVIVYGRRIMGQYWAPEPVAGVVNNYLSPGISTTLKNWFPGPAGRGLALTADAWRGIGNTLNQAQLGLSGFHLGMTSLDATVSRTALGLQYLADGKPLSAVEKILTSPIASLPGIVQGTVGDLSNHLLGTDFRFGLGARIRAAYLDPANAPPDMVALANAVKEAGGRVTMDSYYKNSVLPHYFDLLRQEWQALKGGNFREAAEKDFLAGNRAIPALMEMVTKPLMEHIVPLQKLQVFGEQAQRILADLPPDASLTERRGALQEAWDSTDNRMGQLVYDNLFWHRTFKDLAMLSTRSVGWNLGTIRELGGGMVDLAKVPVTKRLTPAAAYALSLPATVALYGAAYQYLRTGQGPQELKDYFYPRTGDEDADGNPERVQLPSYMKDLFAYSHHPFNTITHKVSPLPSMVWDMMQNQDFYTNEIRNPHDPLVRQLQQEAEFIGRTVTPFGIRNAMESAQRGDSRITQAQSELGITPAPRELVRTPAENLMHDYARERGSGGATPEMVEARADRATIVAGLRGNKGVDLEQAISQAIEHGNLVGPDLAKLLKRAGMTPDEALYKTMSLPQAMEIFKIAQPREQAKLAEILAKKIEKAQK